MKNDGRIRSVIADDEDLSRARIRGLLKHHPEVEVVAECTDGLQTADAILKLAPDLLFLDVQMPGLTGFGVLKKLPAESIPLVIFVTAYDQYALKAFELHALDYILKPFKRKRFDESLEWAKDQLGSKNPAALVHSNSFHPGGNSTKNRLCGSIGNQIQWQNNFCSNEGD